MAFLDREMHWEENIFVGKNYLTKVKIEKGVEDLMKGERKVKWEFEYGVSVGKVGELPFSWKEQIGNGKLDEHCWVGAKILQSWDGEVEKKKEELTSKIGQRKLF